MSEAKYFKELGSRSKNLSTLVEQINQRLKSVTTTNLPSLHVANEQHLFTHLVQHFKHNDTIFRSLDKFVQTSIIQNNDLQNHISEMDNNWRIEDDRKLDIFKKDKKAERIEMWKLWTEKLVRWSGGAIAAVLLYSTAVWASENSTFIKVPVTHWFQPAPISK